LINETKVIRGSFIRYSIFYLLSMVGICVISSLINAIDLLWFFSVVMFLLYVYILYDIKRKTIILTKNNVQYENVILEYNYVTDVKVSGKAKHMGRGIFNCVFYLDIYASSRTKPAMSISSKYLSSQDFEYLLKYLTLKITH